MQSGPSMAGGRVFCINPLSPPLRSQQQRPQGHPAKSKFLAVSAGECPGWNWMAPCKPPEKFPCATTSNRMSSASSSGSAHRQPAERHGSPLAQSPSASTKARIGRTKNCRAAPTQGAEPSTATISTFLILTFSFQLFPILYLPVFHLSRR